MSSTHDAESSSRPPRTRTRWVVEGIAVLVGVTLLYLAWRADAHWFERHFQASRCFRDVRAIRRASISRVLLAATGVLFVLGVRPLLGRVAGRRSPWDVVASFARIAVAALLALPVAELYLRWKEKPPAPFVMRADLPPVLRSELTAWALAPESRTEWKIGGRDVTYAVNADATRAKTPQDALDLDAPTLLFSGESVTLGLGLTYEESYPAIVGQHLGVQVANVGVQGFSGEQTYSRTLEMLARLKKPVAVITMVLPEQVERNVLDTHRLARLREAGLFGPATSPSFWKKLRLRVVWEDLVPYYDDEAVDLERFYLRDAAKATRARGAAPFFLLTNYATPCLPVEGDNAPWLYRTLFDGQDLPRIDAPIDPAWKLSDDPHPDARADRQIAAVIEKALRDAHLPGL